MRLSRAHFAPSGPEKRVASAHFSLSVRPASKGMGAVVVPKKVARLSVTRHRLKRQIYSVMRPKLNTPGIYIVYARPGSASLPFQTLKEELEGLFTRI